jgi:hypothetical protein
MADISTELQTIQSNAYGDPVRNAISSAMTTLQGDTDIASELYTITNGRYGSDIRMAIHDALYKLSISGGSGGSGPLVDNPFKYISGFSNPTFGKAQEYDGVVTGTAIGCLGAYYFDGMISWTVNGRTYSTLTSEERIGAIIHMLSGGEYFTSAIFFSPTPTGVSFTYGNDNPLGSLTYDGATWYYSNGYYAMGGTLDDSTGLLTTYDTPLNIGPDGYYVSELEILLDYVQAFAVSS